MRKYIFSLAILSMLLLTSNAVGQSFGYVNSQELIQSIPEVKEANANIETYRSQFQKKGQDMLKNLQSKYLELEKKQGRGEISPKQLEDQAAGLKLEEQELVKFEQESQQKIVQKSETLLQPLREKIQNAINEVAAEKGYTYIFDFSTGFLLYADQAADVSQLVRTKLGI